MKKTPSRVIIPPRAASSVCATTVVLTLFLLSFCSLPARAQFFKQLVNTVKQTAQGRANSKADQTTNKALDKVDSTTLGSGGNRSGTGGSGTTPGGNVNPSDTSAAGVMKMLGLLTGGGGVSAADSATAIRSFATGSGGNGTLYTYIMTMTSRKSVSKDTNTTWFTDNGNGRVEMHMPIPGVQTAKMITLGHAGQPQYSISLYPDSKTYSLNVIDTALINGIKETFQVTRVGTETVGGYSCIHVRLTSTTGSGLFKSSSTSDVWTSTGVPGYTTYKRLVAMQSVKPGMMQALEQAGAGGFFVKMAASGKDYSMSIELAGAEQRSFPSSLFVIPPGYAETNENMMYHMMMGAKKQ